MAQLHLSLIGTEMDPECRDSGDCIEIMSIGILEDDEFICPDCADRKVPGFAQIVRGLDLIHEAVCLDGLRRMDAETVAHVMFKLAGQIDGLARGDMAVRVHRAIETEPDEAATPIGVNVSREIVKA